MKRLYFPIVVIAVVSMLLMTVSTSAAHSGVNPGLFPPNARIAGKTMTQWSVKYWQYVLTLPASKSPFMNTVGTGCVYKRIGNVVLMATDWGRPVVTCEVPAGTILQFFILATECSTIEPPPYYGGNKAELRACMESFTFENLYASIDGISVRDPGQYIYTTPLYEFTVPEDNVFGVPSGTTAQSMGRSFFLALKPLTPGKHILDLSGYFPEVDFTPVYHIEVIVHPGH